MPRLLPVTNATRPEKSIFIEFMLHNVGMVHRNARLHIITACASDQSIAGRFAGETAGERLLIDCPGERSPKTSTSILEPLAARISLPTPPTIMLIGNPATLLCLRTFTRFAPARGALHQPGQNFARPDLHELVATPGGFEPLDRGRPAYAAGELRVQFPGEYRSSWSAACPVVLPITGTAGRKASGVASNGSLELIRGRLHQAAVCGDTHGQRHDALRARR